MTVEVESPSLRRNSSFTYLNLKSIAQFCLTAVNHIAVSLSLMKSTRAGRRLLAAMVLCLLHSVDASAENIVICYHEGDNSADNEDYLKRCTELVSTDANILHLSTNDIMSGVLADWRIAQLIREAEIFLTVHYDPGDDLYILGTLRSASVVRGLMNSSVVTRVKFVGLWNCGDKLDSKYVDISPSVRSIVSSCDLRTSGLNEIPQVHAGLP